MWSGSNNHDENIKHGSKPVVFDNKVYIMRVRTWVYESKVDWKNVKGPYTSRVPIACIRVLIEYEAMADPDTQERFKRWARGDCRDIRFEIDLAIARRMGRDFMLSRYDSPNLKRFFKEADKLEKAGAHMDAVQIYKGITESIGVHMDFIPDRDGDCSYAMEEAIENITRCIQAARLDDDQRRKEIQYMAMWSMRVIDWFAPNYAEALAKICQDAKDIELWEYILDNPPEVEKNYSGASSLSVKNLREKLEERRKSCTH